MVTFSLYSGLDLDGALMKPTMNFLQKLSVDPTNPSLRIKTLSNACLLYTSPSPRDS